MKSTLSALLALTMFTGTAAAADKPNFSGDWKMNAAKSNFGPVPAPKTIVRKVTHAEPSMVIVEDQQSDFGDQNTTRTYRQTGKKCPSNPMVRRSQGRPSGTAMPLW